MRVDHLLIRSDFSRRYVSDSVHGISTLCRGCSQPACTRRPTTAKPRATFQPTTRRPLTRPPCGVRRPNRRPITHWWRTDTTRVRAPSGRTVMFSPTIDDSYFRSANVRALEARTVTARPATVPARRTPRENPGTADFASRPGFPSLLGWGPSSFQLKVRVSNRSHHRLARRCTG